MTGRSNRSARGPREKHRERASPRLLGALRLMPVLLTILAATLVAQSRPLVAPAAAAIYQRLLPQISRIKLFDHHAHPAFPDDADVDIAPPPPGATPLRLRADNPDTSPAARALFQFPYNDTQAAPGKCLPCRQAP